MSDTENLADRWSPAYERVLRQHLRHAEGVELAAVDSLGTLGLDSLEAVQLLIDLETDLGIEFPDEALTAETFATVGSLWDSVTLLAAEQGIDPYET